MLVEQGRSAITLRVGQPLAKGAHTLHLEPKKGDPLSVALTIGGQVEVFSSGGSGVQGTAAALLQAGVRGTFDATETYGFGTIGELFSDSGIGVWGRCTAETGDVRGVVGASARNMGICVDGTADSSTGAGIGVREPRGRNAGRQGARDARRRARQGRGADHDALIRCIRACSVGR